MAEKEDFELRSSHGHTKFTVTFVSFASENDLKTVGTACSPQDVKDLPETGSRGRGRSPPIPAP